MDNTSKITLLTPIEAFCAYYLADELTLPVPSHHRFMYRDVSDRSLKRLVFIAPRFYAKSTVCTKILPLFEVCEGEVGEIIIVSQTQDGAISRLNEIKSEIEYNKAILADFGVMRTDKWTETEIVIKNGTRSIRIRARGKGSQIRGFHPDLLIFDDLESDEEVRSDDQRLKLEDWFWGAAIPTLPNDGRAVMVGTKLHPLCLIGKLENNPAWLCRKYKAICEDGTALWPEKDTLEQLRQKQIELGDRKFNAEYQNEPVVSENPVFTRAWFRPYDHKSPEFRKKLAKGVYSVIAIDPAFSEKENMKADYTGIVTLSATFDEPTEIYVRVGGTVRDRWLVENAITKFARIYKEFLCRKAIVETVGAQKGILGFIKNYERDHRESIDYLEVKPHRDKVARAEIVAPMVQHGNVYFDPTDETSARLIEECCMLPTGDHDDLCDAFVYAMGYLREWIEKHKARSYEKPVIVRPHAYRRAAVAGLV